jgi:hypothetical protein
MNDPFVGTWRLNPGRSLFDANHRPQEGTMRWEIDAQGRYLMTAEGRTEKGEPVRERPQTLVPDGSAYPVPDFPGLSATTTRVDARTLHGKVTREDGSVVGEGTYAVSDDGRWMTATTAGFDTQLRRFEMKTAWERV